MFPATLYVHAFTDLEIIVKLCDHKIEYSLQKKTTLIRLGRFVPKIGMFYRISKSL